MWALAPDSTLHQEGSQRLFPVEVRRACPSYPSNQTDTQTKSVDRPSFTITSLHGGSSTVELLANRLTVFQLVIVMVSDCMILLLLVFAALCQRDSYRPGKSVAHSLPVVDFVCKPTNTLFRLLESHYGPKTLNLWTIRRYDSVADLLAHSKPHNGTSSSLLVLAESYPGSYTSITSDQVHALSKLNISAYIEYPSEIPGFHLSKSGVAVSSYFRVVAKTTTADAKYLRSNQLMKMSGLTVAKIQPEATALKSSLLVAGRVAGYDIAPFGPPSSPLPILFSTTRFLYGLTALSGFHEARNRPLSVYRDVFREILSRLDPRLSPSLGSFPRLTTTVSPMYSKSEALPPNARSLAVSAALEYLSQPALLVRSPDPRAKTVCLLDGKDATNLTCMVSGYESAVSTTGQQPLCPAVRADCVVESAMAFALDPKYDSYARDLMEYIYVQSKAQAKDPKADGGAYGLIAWGLSSPAWFNAFYGDDNARVLLASFGVSALLGPRWDEGILMGVLGNLRTSSRLTGFRAHRLSRSSLVELGWQIHFDSILPVVTVQPHYDAYLWAVFLWAYDHTHAPILREMATEAIKTTMQFYHDGEWTWTETWTEELSRMLLPLAYLVRVDDTKLHRQWLKMVATDLLKGQVPCGAIPERLGKKGYCTDCPPHSNANYGTHEAPIIQETGDPASDFLYTSNFALIGLLEAYYATSDSYYSTALDSLIDFSVRIQAKASGDHSFIRGGWLRSVDWAKFEYWGSSGDIGWGAFSQTTGWSETWVAAVIALRGRDTSLWDVSKKSAIDAKLFKTICPRFFSGLYADLCKVEERWTAEGE